MSSKRQMLSKFSVLLLVIALGAIGVIATHADQPVPEVAVQQSQANTSTKTGDTAKIPNSQLEEDHPSVALPTVLVARKTNAGTELVQRASGKNDTVLFTDVDEHFTVDTYLGLLDNGSVAAAVTADSIHSVRSIATDGSGTSSELLADVGDTPPAISSDGAKLALVQFSNAERSFGFTLIVRSLDGNTQESIASSSSSITLPRWND